MDKISQVPSVFFNLSFIIFQQSMQHICKQYFQNIRKIMQIMQPTLRSKNDLDYSRKNDQRLPFFKNQQGFQRQLHLLKQNIQGLLNYTERLQSQNNLLKKRLFSKQGPILEQNAYSIQQTNKKIQNLIPNSNINSLQNIQCKKINTSKSFEGNVLIKDYNKNEKVQLKQTRQLYLKSLNKIHELKKQINTLNDQLQNLNKNYDEQILVSENRSLKQKDLFNNDNSLCAIDRRVKTQAQNYDLEFLLCHQELILDNSPLKQNDLSSVNLKKKSSIIQSLHAKGIQHLEEKAGRKADQRVLDCVYNLYRQQSYKIDCRPPLKKCQTVSYR